MARQGFQTSLARPVTALDEGTSWVDRPVGDRRAKTDATEVNESGGQTPYECDVLRWKDR